MHDIYEQTRDAVLPRFKVAFIGGGVNSAVGRAHFNAIRMDGLYEVVAGCFSRDSAVNAETGRSYGVDEDRVYDSYADLLAKEREKLDAVVVLTPPVLHEAPVVSAMEAGVPVICEKPLATTPQEARAIREAERRNKAFLAVTYNYTGYPALRELRSLIHEGRLGKLLHFSAEMPQESFLRVDRRGHPLKPQEWRLKDGAIPKVYLDLASHLHQISHYLMDIVPTRVVAHQRSYGNFPGVVDYVDAAVDYGDDVHGTYYFGKSMLGCRNGLRIRVFGDRGSADWEQANSEELRMAYADGRIEMLDRGGLASVCSGDRYARFKAGHPAGYVEAFANLYCDIHSALMMFKNNGEWRSEEVFGSTLALEGLQLLAGMAQAARRETAVRLGCEQVATIGTGYVGGGLE